MLVGTLKHASLANESGADVDSQRNHLKVLSDLRYFLPNQLIPLVSLPYAR